MHRSFCWFYHAVAQILLEITKFPMLKHTYLCKFSLYLAVPGLSLGGGGGGGGAFGRKSFHILLTFFLFRAEGEVNM